jgi:hypothetical protein
MMGCIDIEDVKSDPLYKETNDAAIEMTSGFDHNDSMHKANAKYISDNIRGENEDEKLAEEINDIKKESRRNDLGNITAEWVRKWDEKQLNKVIPDPMSEERKEFITNSLVEADQICPVCITGSCNTHWSVIPFKSAAPFPQSR